MKTMLDSLRLVTALHPRVDYCLLVDTIQVPASRHRDLPGHFPKKCIKSPRYLSTINFKNPIFIAPSFTEPSLLNPTNQQLQTPSIHPSTIPPPVGRLARPIPSLLAASSLACSRAKTSWAAKLVGSMALQRMPVPQIGVPGGLEGRIFWTNEG